MVTKSYTLLDPASDWPQRLLHVQSATSFERQPGNKYGGIEEPAYNILSYTWGRWETDSVAAIDIKGISWSVPSVESSHFSVENFSSAIQKAGTGVDFIWLDVACIDQQNDAMKLQEVNKQMAIFERADQAYIWLSHISTRSLEDSIDIIVQSSGDITDYVNNWYPCSRQERERWVQSCCESLTTIFSDPWWSSLWTLQEAYLRKDAFLLSREADTVGPELPHSHWLAALTSDSSRIYRELVGLISDGTQQLHYHNMETIEQIIQCISQSGCYDLETPSPIVLYSTSSRRKTARPLDRIYGVMQVFGLQLGKARTATGTELTLEELEDEFGQALISKSPILAQLFVHTEPASPGRAWRISQTAQIPERARACVSPKSHGRITFDGSDQATFDGQCCDFRKLKTLWKEASKSPDIPGDCSIHSIHLDRTPMIEAKVPARLLHMGIGMDVEQHALADHLQTLYNGCLSVLLVGSMTSVMKGRKNFTRVGLIVTREMVRGVLSWLRVGICFWFSSRDEALDGEEAIWSPVKAVLG